MTLCGVQQRILFHVVGNLTDQLCTSAKLFSKTLEGELMLNETLVDAAERQTATLEMLLIKHNEDFKEDCKLIDYNDCSTFMFP